MDRSLWREKYPEDSYPAFPCPKCKNGLLKRVNDKGVTVWEEGDDPMVASGKFTSFFACSHAFCRTVAVLSGIANSGPYYYIDQDGEEQMDEETNFYPKSMIPGPRIIAIPGKTPKAVSDEIIQIIRTVLDRQEFGGKQAPQCGGGDSRRLRHPESYTCGQICRVRGTA